MFKLALSSITYEGNETFHKTDHEKVRKEALIPSHERVQNSNYKIYQHFKIYLFFEEKIPINTTLTTI